MESFNIYSVELAAIVVGTVLCIPNRRSRYVAQAIVIQGAVSLAWKALGWYPGFFHWCVLLALSLIAPRIISNARNENFDVDFKTGKSVYHPAARSGKHLALITFFSLITFTTMIALGDGFGIENGIGPLMLLLGLFEIHFALKIHDDARWANPGPKNLEELREHETKVAEIVAKNRPAASIRPTNILAPKRPQLPPAPPKLSLETALERCKELSPDLSQIVGRYVDEIRRLENETTVSIAVVGEFNSGKSTFINELLDASVARTANEECTAVPLRITHAQLKATYRGRISGGWTSLSYEDFLNAQTAPSKGLDLLELGMYSRLLQGSLVNLVDTPGASSKNPILEGRALDAVADADACIVLMDSAQDGSKSFLYFLSLVRKRQGRIFLLFSRCDQRSDEELEAQRRDTIPKLERLLGVSGEQIQFVGIHPRPGVSSPQSAFQRIVTYIQAQRAIILEEKRNRFYSEMKDKLGPLLQQEEKHLFVEKEEAKALPSSFEELWSQWLRSLAEIPWNEIGHRLTKELRARMEAETEEFGPLLKKTLEGAWLEHQKCADDANRCLMERFDHFRQQAIQGFFREFQPIATKLEIAAKPVYSYLEKHHGISINPGWALIELMKSNPEEGMALDIMKWGPRTPEQMHYYVAMRLIFPVNEGIDVEIEPIEWDTEGFGKAGGRAGSVLGMGHPLLALGIMAVGLISANEEANEDFVNHAKVCFYKTCAGMIASFERAIIGTPSEIEGACDKITKLLERQHGELFRSRFANNQTKKDVTADRYHIISSALDALALPNNLTRKKAA